VDIRDSSKLSEKHYRPKLAKLYRAYLSEVVAIMEGEQLCLEINIIGDGVSGIFSTSVNLHADTVLETAAKIMSLVKILNFKFRKNNIESVRIGMGISWGRALMVKAGCAGSGINDVVWMGNVVNEASKLASRAGKTNGLALPIWFQLGQSVLESHLIVSKSFYDKLSRHNQDRLYQDGGTCYQGIVNDSEMESWYERNCRQSFSKKLLYSPY
jgi:class 3 adenylate cyclase